MPDSPTLPADIREPRAPLGVTLRRFAALARPYRARLAVSIGLLLVATSVGLVVPLGLKGLLDSVFTTVDGSLLNRLALGLFGLFAIQAVLGAVGGYLLDWTGERVVADLRTRLYAHINRLGLRFFAETRTGEITQPPHQRRLQGPDGRHGRPAAGADAEPDARRLGGADGDAELAARARRRRSSCRRSRSRRGRSASACGSSRATSRTTSPRRRPSPRSPSARSASCRRSRARRSRRPATAARSRRCSSPPGKRAVVTSIFWNVVAFLFFGGARRHLLARRARGARGPPDRGRPRRVHRLRAQHRADGRRRVAAVHVVQLGRGRVRAPLRAARHRRPRSRMRPVPPRCRRPSRGAVSVENVTFAYGTPSLDGTPGRGRPARRLVRRRARRDRRARRPERRGQDDAARPPPALLRPRRARRRPHRRPRPARR